MEDKRSNNGHDMTVEELSYLLDLLDQLGPIMSNATDPAIRVAKELEHHHGACVASFAANAFALSLGTAWQLGSIMREAIDGRIDQLNSLGH